MKLIELDPNNKEHKQLLDCALQFRRLCASLNVPEDAVICGVTDSCNLEKSYLKGKAYEKERIRGVLGV